MTFMESHRRGLENGFLGCLWAVVLGFCRALVTNGDFLLFESCVYLISYCPRSPNNR